MGHGRQLALLSGPEGIDTAPKTLQVRALHRALPWLPDTYGTHDFALAEA